MNESQSNLSQDLLQLPVEGRNLQGGSLGDQLREPTLLVFLRHFG